jgi:large subunit ribosomal protein L9
MKLVLTQDVVDLGHKGDVVDVAEGYGRNYLLPRSMAIKATAGALKDAQALREAREAAEAVARETAEQIAQALADTTVVVTARAADEGKLFGSIGARDVAEAIAKYTGVVVPAEQIRLAGPIKEIGLHEVIVKPHPDIEARLTLDVIPAQ